MYNFSVARRICLSLAVFFGCLGPAFAGEQQWIEVRSPHFSVVTDAGEKRGRETALKFEQMRAVFGEVAVFSGGKPYQTFPLQIIAFRNSKELRRFSPLWHGKATEVSGLFLAGSDQSFILLDMSVEDPWAPVFHEYTHQLLEGNDVGETQPWFDEGFAEYFSTTEINGNQAKVGIKSPPGDVEILQQYGTMKVSELFRVQHNSQTYNEGDRRSVFYATSWLLVHYLYDTGQISKTGPFFEAVLQRKVVVEDAIQQVFGITAQQFDQNLRQYLSRGRILYAPINLSSAIQATSCVSSPVTLVNARALLAEVHLYHPDYGRKAVDELLQVLGEDPSNVVALTALGYAALRDHNASQAAAYFQKAIETGPRDPRPYYYAALLLAEQSRLRDPEKRDLIIKDLRTAISLDPNFPDAHALLAHVLMALGDRRQAVDSMKKAITLSQRHQQRVDYYYDLSQMFVAMGKVNEATSILQALANSTNPETAAKAQAAMEQIKKMKTVFQAMSEHTPGGGMVPAAASESVTSPTIAVKDNEEELHPLTAATPPKFLKGQLLSVDCSNAPGAVLTVVSGGKTLKMKVADTKHAIVIGADDFSCNWAQKKVAVNYRESSGGEMKVMTVEIQ